MKPLPCTDEILHFEAIDKVCPKEWRIFCEALESCTPEGKTWHDMLYHFAEATESVEPSLFDDQADSAIIGYEMINILWKKVSKRFAEETGLFIHVGRIDKGSVSHEIPDGTAYIGVHGVYEYTNTFKRFLKKYYPKAPHGKTLSPHETIQWVIYRW